MNDFILFKRAKSIAYHSHALRSLSIYLCNIEWVPQSGLGYAFTLVACFALAIFYEAVKAFKSWLDNRWKLIESEGSEAETASLIGSGGAARLIVPPFDFSKDSVRYY